LAAGFADFFAAVAFVFALVFDFVALALAMWPP
jgi:hypothetical protein